MRVESAFKPWYCPRRRQTWGLAGIVRGKARPEFVAVRSAADEDDEPRWEDVEMIIEQSEGTKEVFTQWLRHA